MRSRTRSPTQTRELRGRAFAAALAVAGASGCYPNARWYEPVTPRKSGGPSGDVEAIWIRRDGPHTVVTARVHPSSTELAFGRPRLASPETPPCSAGSLAESWSSAFTDKPEIGEPKEHGLVVATFPNAQTDRDGFLLTRPTDLDVPVTLGTPVPENRCLRVPLLESGGGEPEWHQEPRWWTGIELRTEVPLHRLSGIDDTLLVPISVGALAGPVRVGADFDFGIGFGPGDSRSASGGAGILGVGARVDSPLLVVRRFAMGLLVGYELEGWNYGTDVATKEPLSVEVHGPRAALRFLLLPPPPPSSKYDARPDTWSTGIELGCSLLYVIGDGSPTAAIGGSYFGDIAW